MTEEPDAVRTDEAALDLPPEETANGGTPAETAEETAVLEPVGGDPGLTMPFDVLAEISAGAPEARDTEVPAGAPEVPDTDPPAAPGAAAAPEPEPALAPDVTAVLPPVTAETAPPPPIAAAPAIHAVPDDPAWPLVGRVLVLPRSSFRRIAAEDLRVWGPAFGVLAVTALAKGGVAAALVLTGSRVASRLVAATGVLYGTALVGPLVFAAVAAALLMLMQPLWQGDAPFGRLLSATSLSLMPLAVRNLLQAGYMAGTRAPLIHPGLSPLLGRVPYSPLGISTYGLLAQIDLFTLWSFVLLTLAVGATRGRGGFRTFLAVVVTVLVWLAIGLLPSFAASALLH